MRKAKHRMKQEMTMHRIRLLMVGVGPKCIGGMWSVAKSYLDSPKPVSYTHLTLPTKA